MGNARTFGKLNKQLRMAEGFKMEPLLKKYY